MYSSLKNMTIKRHLVELEDNKAVYTGISGIRCMYWSPSHANKSHETVRYTIQQWLM